LEGIPPAKGGFSREEFDRIIRRASELQFEDSGSSGPGDVVGEEELLRIGKEVGIEPRHLRRALGEVRAEALRPVPSKDEGVLARVVGPGFVRVSRVVPGPFGALEKRLEDHFAEGESLRRLRKRGDRSLWEPAGGVRAVVRRALKVGGSSYDLVRAKSLELSLVPLPEGQVLVTMTADVRSVRSGAGVGGMLGMGIPAAAVGTGLGFGFGFPLIGIPAALVGLAGGAAIGRAHLAGESARIRIAMEGILDRLEAGEPLATLRPGDWRARFAR
jgi:hypothetical protein